MAMYVEEGQYVVLYSQGGAETVYATAYGEEDVKRQLELCKREHPEGITRWGKAIRVAATRQEPWTLEPGEDS